MLLDSYEDCKIFVDISKKAYNLQNILPCAYKIVRFVLTLPISASSKRSFSKLKLIMNHLRTTMSDERLDYLMLLFSSKDIEDKINVSEIVQTWFKLKFRQVKT
jgi:hypothetical protein